MTLDFQNKKIESTKIIDFGTSFKFENLETCISMTTPEYLPPEVLQHLENSGQSKNNILSCDKLYPWSIDIWSLGIVLLEFVIGFPIYMAYKGKIRRVETG